MKATYAQVVAAKEAAENRADMLRLRIECLEAALAKAQTAFNDRAELLLKEADEHIQLRLEHEALKRRVRAALGN